MLFTPPPVHWPGLSAIHKKMVIKIELVENDILRDLGDQNQKFESYLDYSALFAIFLPFLMYPKGLFFKKKIPHQAPQ